MVASVESAAGAAQAHARALRLRLLGPMEVLRDGRPLALPPSRKVRALVALLAAQPRGIARSRLCELLWDLPNDPRGELRWCLSKARALLDHAQHTRVLSDADTVRLDLDDGDVDVREVDRALRAGVDSLDAGALRRLASHFAGDFLQGLEIARAPAFSAWLVAQRRHYRAAHAVVLEHLARATPAHDDEAIVHVERWLQLAPLDRRAHEQMLEVLARRGRLADGDEHLAVATRLFEAEGQDWRPIGLAWRRLRAGLTGSSTAAATAPRPEAAAPPIVAAPVADGAADPSPRPARRASIAVMPFADVPRPAGPRSALSHGLTFDVIARLAKLRSMFVIAQGTVFALDARDVGAEEAGRALDVDYVCSGSLRRDGERVDASVQLVETRTARIVWADTFAARADGALSVLDEIGNRIVASIALRIEEAERNRAVLKPPDSLDAWEAHHRGLWHMFRFNREDNEQAHHFFDAAVKLDPTFSRPWAGLSFTHFQNAFLGWGEREREVEAAYRTASQALAADELDPSAHWALGRALWLRGRVDASLGELDTAVELSPNFALGHYTRAFIHAQSGDPEAGIRASDHSRELSPFDPLLFAMLCTRAIALMRLGRFDEAADWALRAVARPNAHVHILGIAAHCLALADRLDEAHAVVASIRRQVRGYRVDDLIAAFRFGDDALALMRRVSPRIGL